MKAQKFTSRQLRLMNLICEECDVDREMMLSRNRMDHIVIARHVFFLILYETSILTHSAIGDVLGLNHDTVTKGIQSIRDRIDTDLRIAKCVGRIRLRLSILK